MKIEDYVVIKNKIIAILQENYNNENILLGTWKGMVRFICSRLSEDFVFYDISLGEANLLYDNISNCLEQLDKSPTDAKCITNLRDAISHLYIKCRRNVPSFASNFNSEDYYTKQIQELQEKEKTLKNELSDLKQKTAEHAKKEKELEDIKEQIEQSKAEKEDLKKKLDASENMKARISTAFDELKKHISPLKKEEKRLNWMFYSYAILCVVVFGLLVCFECSYLSKWEGAKSWIDYIPYYIPVPIVGGLLWAFIFQMNRAQRQLMQIANVLYHIDYVEGLLLAINLVSADINSASDKICQVLDNLIRNYMPTSDNLSEQAIETEISKDYINSKTFINLVKEIKDLIK